MNEAIIASSPSPATTKTYSIDNGVFNLFEVGGGQTQFDASEISGAVSSSDGSFPTGAKLELKITLNPGGQTFNSIDITVQADGSLSYPFGDTQFIATGNTSATGVFTFFDPATYGASSFTFTDSDLTK